MTITPTHQATCTDDDVVIPLVMAADGAVCDLCGSPAHWQPVNCDGGPGAICEVCRYDLSWSIRRIA